MNTYFDKNGTPIRTGMVVRVSNAYHKTDNGLFLVTRTPGDPCWLGDYISMTKISRSGKLSTEKYRLSSWPLTSYANSRAVRYEADRWNRENAVIEAASVTSCDGIRAFFENEASDRMDQAGFEFFNHGDNKDVQRLRSCADWLRSIAKEATVA